VKNKNIVDVKNNVYFSVALGLVTNAACHSNEAMKKIVSLLVKILKMLLVENSGEEQQEKIQLLCFNLFPRCKTFYFVFIYVHNSSCKRWSIKYLKTYLHTLSMNINEHEIKCFTPRKQIKT
jgi:hypothetical protein